MTTTHTHAGDKGREAIAATVRDFGRYTCILMEERTDQHKYLKYVDDEKGCMSYVGMSSQMPHLVSRSLMIYLPAMRTTAAAVVAALSLVVM